MQNTEYQELLKNAAEKLAIQWWKDMESKVGNDYTRDFAKYYADEILKLSKSKIT